MARNKFDWIKVRIKFVGERIRAQSEEQWKVKHKIRLLKSHLRMTPRRRRGIEGTIEIEGREHREGIYT